MSEVKKCPKCEGVMIKGSEQIPDDAFRCTRVELRALRDSRNTASGFNLTVVRTAGISNSTRKEGISHEKS
jgi:hypothetical protein